MASLFLLVALAPLMILIAVFVWLGSKGPVFFRQLRVGHGGEDFLIYKFRTLHCNDNGSKAHREYLKAMGRHAPAIKPSFENRLVPGGRLLRSLSLDELPQLLNVIRGEMSLIGPRPDVLALGDYDEVRDLRRFEVLPGVTGLWQVSGKNKLTQQEMIDLDIRYVDSLSPALDAKIFCKTFFVLLGLNND